MSRRYIISVCNIPWTISHLDLETYFTKFGSVRHARTLFDKHGLNTGYGIVEFHDRCAMIDVLKQKHTLEGMKIDVSPDIAYIEQNINIKSCKHDYIIDLFKRKRQDPGEDVLNTTNHLPLKTT